MKKRKIKAWKLLSKIALSAAEKEANSACFLFGYQPKIPETLLVMNKNRK